LIEGEIEKESIFAKAMGEETIFTEGLAVTQGGRQI
jgi:hypothetical protein